MRRKVQQMLSQPHIGEKQLSGVYMEVMVHCQRLQGDTLNSNIDTNIGLLVTQSCCISSEGSSSSSIFRYLISWPRVKKTGRCLCLTAQQQFVASHNQNSGSHTSTYCPCAVDREERLHLRSLACPPRPPTYHVYYVYCTLLLQTARAIIHFSTCDWQDGQE